MAEAFAERMERCMELKVRVAVAEPQLLWDVAAKHLGVAGLDDDAIVETIGSRYDPQIEDCLAIVLMPKRIDGCDLELFQIGQAQRADPVDGISPGAGTPR